MTDLVGDAFADAVFLLGAIPETRGGCGALDSACSRDAGGAIILRKTPLSAGRSFGRRVSENAARMRSPAAAFSKTFWEEFAVGFFLLLVFFVVSLLIVGLVLLQEGKGGGLTGMSTGMDGVMGAKNPLRRMTAYLFTFFVIMAIGINYYFHRQDDSALPAGVPRVEATRTLEQTLPLGSTVVGEGELRPQDGATEDVPAAPVRPEADDSIPPAPTDSIRPADAPETEDVPAAPEAETVESPAAANPAGPEIRPEAAETAAPASVQPPADESAEQAGE